MKYVFSENIIYEIALFRRDAKETKHSRHFNWLDLAVRFILNRCPW